MGGGARYCRVGFGGDGADIAEGTASFGAALEELLGAKGRLMRDVGRP